MFHRVKSETDYKSPENQDVETQETAAVDVEETSALQEQAQETAAEVTQVASPDVEEDVVEETVAPAQNLYQRAAATPARPTTSYVPRPAATPTYSAPAQSVAVETASVDAEEVGDRRLTIGRGITMSGEIESCDYLYVEGTVEAALKGASDLEIAESGVFYGSVEIQDATIAGRFEGEIIVHGSLTVESTGVVTGSITYKELAVESGAVIDGRITPISAAQPVAQSKPAKKKAKRVVKAPANEGLFATEAAE